MPEALFVGRERETDVYKKFLARKTPWVLIITGLGGIGKSTLLHRLAEYTSKEPTLSETGVVTLDFADEELRNDPLKLLDELTKDTAPYCDLLQIDVELKNELQQDFDQLAQLCAERVQTGINEAEDPALREMRHQMRQLATEAFYLQIKTFKLLRLIIMLDTCEWLNEPEGVEVGQWVLNELIPGIHTRIRQKGHQCFVVIASRVQPRLDVINGQEQRRLDLPMLGKAEVDQYLVNMGMQDTDLRQRVYKVTHGHALCISIIGDSWQNREEGIQPLTLADLPEQQLEVFSEKALIQFTNERVLKQLKSPYKELTRYGVLLRSFDLPLLKIVFPELLPESAALERFNQFIRYPYIESRGNYRYAFHELVHEALAEETQKEEPEIWRSYHKRALDYFTTVSPRSPDWYYHLLAYDEKQGLVEWQQAIQEARESGKREYIGALLQAALDKALKLSPAAHAEIVYEQGRFNYYDVQWEEALKSYREALTAFQEVGDYSGQAKVLQAMGDVRRAFAKQDDALESYENALAAFRQAGDQLGEARCYQAMGDVWRLRKDQDAALQNYEQALDLFRQIGNQPEEAKVLEAMGDIQRLRKDQDVALRSYEQALALYQEEKDRLKRAKVLKAMGDVHQLQQNKNAAQESYEQALALFGELKEPTEEANVRRAIEEMQRYESRLVPYAIPEYDQQVGYTDSPTIEVSYDSLPPSLLLQGNYTPEVILNGPFGRKALGSTVVTIGRTSGNQLVLIDSKVSRVHAEIRPSDQGYSIIDLASANGTFVNEKKIDTNVSYTLNLGDRVRIGDTSFTYEVNSASQIAPPVDSSADKESIPEPESITANMPSPLVGNTPSPSAGSTQSPAHELERRKRATYTAPQRRQGFLVVAFLLIVLTLLIAAGSIEFLLIQRATLSAQVTAIAQIKATATAAVQAEATATASVIAANPDPYSPLGGTLALYDPLRDNTQGNHWIETLNNANGDCEFLGGAYEVIQSNPTYFYYCLALSTNFSNFAYEVQMKILKGDGGGIVFRADNTGAFYRFDVFQDGHYAFFICPPGNPCNHLVTTTPSSAIKPGLNQTNIIAVVANGPNFTFYVNHHRVTSFNDLTFNHGQIGVLAIPLVGGQPTEVAYSNAKVWTF